MLLFYYFYYRYFFFSKSIINSNKKKIQDKILKNLFSILIYNFITNLFILFLLYAKYKTSRKHYTY